MSPCIPRLLCNVCLTISPMVSDFVCRRQFQRTSKFLCQEEKQNPSLRCTSQSFSFRILQHFATKLCNFTIFKMLLLAIVMDFGGFMPGSEFIRTLELPIFISFSNLFLILSFCEALCFVARPETFLGCF